MNQFGGLHHHICIRVITSFLLSKLHTPLRFPHCHYSIGPADVSGHPLSHAQPWPSLGRSLVDYNPGDCQIYVHSCETQAA